MPIERCVTLKDDYIAGFIDGEGCFLISRKGHNGRPCFAITFHVAQRADNSLVLELMQEQIGGYLNFEPPTPNQLKRLPGHKPQYRLFVCNRRDVLRLIEYIDQHPLICKAAEYQVWREAAYLYYRHAPGHGGGRIVPKWLIEAMNGYKTEIERLRKYDAKPRDLVAIPDEDQPELF